MIKFEKPKNLSGTKLLIELADSGIEITEKNPIVIEANEDFYVAINPKDQAKVAAIIAAHDGADFTY